jgi:hypothetical protein
LPNRTVAAGDDTALHGLPSVRAAGLTDLSMLPNSDRSAILRTFHGTYQTRNSDGTLGSTPYTVAVSPLTLSNPQGKQVLKLSFSSAHANFEIVANFTPTPGIGGTIYFINAALPVTARTDRPPAQLNLMLSVRDTHDFDPAQSSLNLREPSTRADQLVFNRDLRQ